jgi:hypothetical protein
MWNHRKPMISNPPMKKKHPELSTHPIRLNLIAVEKYLKGYELTGQISDLTSRNP